MRDRELLLVTGAPRSGTTPVGNTLALTRGSGSFYEPLGPTGLRRIRNRFPMRTTGDLDDAELTMALEDISTLRGALKTQTREGQRPTARSVIIGSRTLHSRRMAALTPGLRRIIWKDPHAIMLVPDLLARRIPCVVTVRSAPAHAASYKRLGWISRAAEIYPRWSARFGRDPVIELALKTAATDIVTSAAVLWRMCYRAVLSTAPAPRLHIVHATELEQDEVGTYRRLLQELGLDWSPRLTRHFAERNKANGAPLPSPRRTHDWSRSVAAANTYWQDVLTEEEIIRVLELTYDVDTALTARIPAAA
ncbi:sulfotransferase [Pontivivens ytuae]|uniref:Sulfotransferase n=1 Tax=Pontivivens ytuae TaxID=2789856 RepID=A0A7S9QE46_9RHOB|nr:sulfotransferase [Pontivivens ytuae]QPH55953.1 sulfotransferase [Pontivivens ytuae]